MTTITHLDATPVPAGGAWTRATLAATIDHTLLRPEASAAQVSAVVAQGVALGVRTICVHPSRMRQVMTELPVPGPDLCVVVGFPTGAHDPQVVAEEARRAWDAGARELDMVVDLGALADGDLDTVRAGIASVRAAAPYAVLKVICESAVLSDAQLVAACLASVEAGADFVKTSTGVHPAGGASVHAVALMAATVAPFPVLVKASGGIRTLSDALAMLEAGAARLGTSASAAILGALPA